jgi:hypothetical protein
MTASTETITIDEKELVEGVFDRISKDVSMIIDREISVESVTAERVSQRPAGEGQVHISFKLGLHGASPEKQGTLLVPLPEAISLAGYLMMIEDDVIEQNRAMEELDTYTKEAILEVGNFIAGATDAVVGMCYPEGLSVRTAGCQGVRPGVRPALAYAEGDELIVGRAELRIHSFPCFEAILILPTP